MSTKALKSVLSATFWNFLHILGHWLDFDRDGRLDVDDLKVVLKKFVEIIPQAAALVPGWGTMELAAKVGAILTIVQKEFPDLSGLKDWVWILLESAGHVFAKVQALPPKG